MGDRVALVTGASRGIGARTALALADAGYDVVVVARSTQSSPGRISGTLDDVADGVRTRGRDAMVLALDVRDEEAVAAAANVVDDRFGRCDLVVNNAGVIVADPILSTSLRRWELVMDVNVTGPFLFMREFVPRMQAAGQGRIVNISSGAVVVPEYPFVSYCASKRALEALTEGAGLQSGPAVAVNALRVDAVVWSEGLEAAQGPEVASQAEDPDVVARAVVWVASQPITTSGRVFLLSEVKAFEVPV